MEAATYAGFIPELLITSKGILRRKLPAEAIHQAVSVLCVPESMREEIIKMAHTRGGHMGIHATIDRLRRRFYFPKLPTKVDDFVKGCKTCQQVTGQPATEAHLGVPYLRLPLPTAPHRLSGAPEP